MCPLYTLSSVACYVIRNNDILLFSALLRYVEPFFINKLKIKGFIYHHNNKWIYNKNTKKWRPRDRPFHAFQSGSLVSLIFGLYQFICIIELSYTVSYKAASCFFSSFLSRTFYDTFIDIVCIDENLPVLISIVCHVWQFPFSFILIKFLLLLSHFHHSSNIRKFGWICKSFYRRKVYQLNFHK